MSRRSTRGLPGTIGYELIETSTRDAIKCAGGTVAYVAIGAEDHGPMLAASNEMYRALRALVKALESPTHGRFVDLCLSDARAAIAKAEGRV